MNEKEVRLIYEDMDKADERNQVGNADSVVIIVDSD